MECYTASNEDRGFLNRVATLAPLMMVQQNVSDIDGIRDIMLSIGESFMVIGRLEI